LFGIIGDVSFAPSLFFFSVMDSEVLLALSQTIMETAPGKDISEKMRLSEWWTFMT